MFHPPLEGPIYTGRAPFVPWAFISCWGVPPWHYYLVRTTVPKMDAPTGSLPTPLEHWHGLEPKWLRSEGFRGVPGGCGYILTKFQVKRRHLDLIHVIFHDFVFIFCVFVAFVWPGSLKVWPSSLKVWPSSLCVWPSSSYGASSKYAATLGTPALRLKSAPLKIARKGTKVSTRGPTRNSKILTRILIIGRNPYKDI